MIEFICRSEGNERRRNEKTGFGENGDVGFRAPNFGLHARTLHAACFVGKGLQEPDCHKRPVVTNPLVSTLVSMLKA